MIMQITKLLTKDTIHLALKGTTKPEAIDELVNVLDQADILNDKDIFKNEILNREKQSTTGVGDGIAIPHAKTKAVKQPAIAFGRSIDGIDYEALDGQPSYLFFMIAVPEDAIDSHLHVLACLSTFLFLYYVHNL